MWLHYSHHGFLRVPQICQAHPLYPWIFLWLAPSLHLGIFSEINSWASCQKWKFSSLLTFLPSYAALVLFTILHSSCLCNPLHKKKCMTLLTEQMGFSEHSVIPCAIFSCSTLLRTCAWNVRGILCLRSTHKGSSPRHLPQTTVVSH